MGQIRTIDCNYLYPRFAASYLLTSGDQAAFIDNNTAHSVPLLLKALSDAGYKPEQVRYVIITHVHLDHAGGTSALMKACPNATLIAHPRATRHMIDPSKLEASARAVYGDEAFERMYGKMGPIDASRVRAMEDGETLPFGEGKPLRFVHTRGHANHHFCIVDPDSRSIFTGDSFGLAYPDLQRAGLFVFPSTSPTDFDYEEAVNSIDKILASGVDTAYPTHFGPVRDLEGAARQLREHLRFSQDLLVSARDSQLADSELAAFCEREIRKHFEESARHIGLALSAHDWEMLKLDLELNAAGIAHVAAKGRAAQK